MGKLERSWRLVRASWSILRLDPKLMLIPVLSTLCIVGAVGAIYVFGLRDVLPDGDEVIELTPGMLAALFFALWTFVLAATFLGLFFNCALVACALIRLEGGQPTLLAGLRIAAARSGTIFGYAILATTVGLVLRLIEERLSIFGKIGMVLIGSAWALATFLVVPVLVVENVGPIQALRNSAGLLRRTWGENAVGQGGLNLFTGIVFVCVASGGCLAFSVAISAGLTAVALAALVATVVVAALLLTVSAALSGIYIAALYRYAKGDGIPAPFDDGALQASFRSR